MENLQVLLAIMSKCHLSFFVKASEKYYTCQLCLLILVLHLSTSQQKFKEACTFCPFWFYKMTTIGTQLLWIRLRDFMIILFKPVRLPYQAMALHFPGPKILLRSIVVGMVRRGEISLTRHIHTRGTVTPGMHGSIVICCVYSLVTCLLGQR